MSAGLENDGEKDDFPDDLHEKTGRSEGGDEDSDDSDLVDLDGPETTGKILRYRLYDLDKIPPDDVQIGDYCRRPIVLVRMPDGRERVAYIITVCLPTKDNEFSSPGFDSIGQYERECVEARRGDAWKLSGMPPYWIMIGEIGASEGFVLEQWKHVLDVRFPGGRTPSIVELTNGTPFKPIELSADMKERSKPASKQDMQKLAETNLVHRIKALMRRCEALLRALMQW